MGLKMTTEMDTKPDKEKVSTIPTHLLSGEFSGWYAELINKTNWSGHPHFCFYPDFNPNVALKDFNAEPKRTVDGLENINKQTDYFYSSNAETRERLQPLIAASLTQYLEQMPPLTSADLVQSNEKISGLLTFDFQSWFVAIEVDDPQTIASNLTTLGRLAQRFNSSGNNSLKVGVLKDWALIGDNGHHFLVSPFLGATLEQTLKQPGIDKNFKGRILATLKRFAVFCEEEGLFWRDLAPRNILIPTETKDELVFIDYEHLYQTKNLDPNERVSLDLSRRIWFGDILEQDEIDSLFDDTQVDADYSSATTPADSLEKIVYSKNEVSLREKVELQQQTALIERLHVYRNNRIFGHRIGRYLTDFVQVEDEAKLYLALKSMDYETFCRYMFVIQACIDADSKQMLSKLYKIPDEGEVITPTFLGDVQQNLDDRAKLDLVLDRYERGLR